MRFFMLNVRSFFGCVTMCLLSSVSFGREINVQINNNEIITVAIESIAEYNTVFLTEQEKLNINAYVVDGIPFIARDAFLNNTEASSKARIIKEYVKNGIKYSAIMVDRSLAILVDDKFMQGEYRKIANNILEPYNPGRCEDVVIGGAIAGAAGGAAAGVTVAGPAGAAVGGAVGAVGGALAAHGSTDSCDDGSNKSLRQKADEAIDNGGKDVWKWIKSLFGAE